MLYVAILLYKAHFIPFIFNENYNKLLLKDAIFVDEMGGFEKAEAKLDTKWTSGALPIKADWVSFFSSAEMDVDLPEIEIDMQTMQPNRLLSFSQHLTPCRRIELS